MRTGAPREATAAETISISVIIPCHDAVSTLGLQLEALASQIDPPPFEVVIVDNRSTDFPEHVLAQHEEALRAGGALDVRIVLAPEEAGASYARNIGASTARAERLVFCDADDCVSARWLVDAAALFSLSPVFSGSAIPIEADRFALGVDGLRELFDISTEPVPRLVAQEELAIPILMGGNFGIRKDLFHELGGFDQSLPSAGEDNDLAVRVRDAVQPLQDTGSMRIAYRQRPPGSGARSAARHAARTHVLLCRRYGVLRYSAHVGRTRLMRSTLMLGAAAVRMLAVPARRDAGGLAVRAAGLLGLWEGLLVHGLLRKVPEPRLGVGLGPDGP